MTADPADILIAGLCLMALVLAGGFTQAVVPEDGDVEFVIEQESLCPEERIGRGCVPTDTSGDTWQLQLIDPFLEDLVTFIRPTRPGNSTSSSVGSPSSASTAEATGTAEPTDAAETGPVTSPTPAPGQRADRADGLGLGSGLGWLRWPLAATIGLLLIAGLALALRRGSIQRPRDLLGLPGALRDVLLSVLVGSAARVAALLRAQAARLLTAVRRPSWFGASLRTRSIGHLGPLRRMLLGLARLPASAIGRLRGRSATDAEVEPGPGADGPAPRAPGPDDFDIRLAWAWLARRTAQRVTGSRTPEEIAADAVDRGFPAEAVGELLAAFRDVTYGGYPPTGERLATARRAFESVRAAHRSSAGGDD